MRATDINVERAVEPPATTDAIGTGIVKETAAAVPERTPDRAVYDGQKTLGFVFFNSDGSADAAGPGGEPLGNFPDREAARAAVVTGGRCDG